MTKLQNIFVILLLFSSCSVTTYSELVPLIKTAAIGTPDIEINQDFIDSIEYSFARVRLGRSSTAVLVLSTIDDNIFTWVSSSNEKIYTHNGKVIRTEGLAYNFESYNFKLFNIETVIAQNTLSYQKDIFFNNPNAFVSQFINLNILEHSDGVIKIGEKAKANGFKWTVTNTYWLDPNTRLPIKSHQYIHPYLPKIEIDYYFK